LGYFTMGPHIVYNKAEDRAEGPLVEFLTRHVAPAMNVKLNLVFIEMPLVRVLTELSSGSIAGAAMFGYTQARAHNHLYPRNNFSEMQSVIAVAKGHPLTQVRSIEDLYPLSLTYVKAAILTPLVRDENLHWEWTSGNNVWVRNLQKLVAGRCEAVYSPQVVNILDAANRSGIVDKIRILPLPEARLKLYSIFSKHPKHRGLMERYDRAMDDIQGRAIYQQLMDEYLSRQAL